MSSIKDLTPKGSFEIAVILLTFCITETYSQVSKLRVALAKNTSCLFFLPVDGVLIGGITSGYRPDTTSPYGELPTFLEKLRIPCYVAWYF